MEGKAWAGTTYGNGWMHRSLIRTLRWMDVRLLYIFAAVFIVPVVLIVNPSRTIIYRYMRQRQGYGRLRAAWMTYVNHCMFSQVVIDKFAMYAGKHFHIDIVGYDHFLERSRRPEAFVQLSAHVGNYEIAGYSLVAADKQFNALVYFGEKETVMESRNQMFSDHHVHMIPVSEDMSHLFLINEVLQKGEIVSMPADRIWGSQKSLRATLLGGEADLPMGPFSVATMRSLDVVAVNVMKSSLKGYTIYVTPLAYDKQAPRREQMNQLVAAYTAELERMLQLYPAQWYNFFEFWK